MGLHRICLAIPYTTLSYISRANAAEISQERNLLSKMFPHESLRGTITTSHLHKNMKTLLSDVPTTCMTEAKVVCRIAAR